MALKNKKSIKNNVSKIIEEGLTFDDVLIKPAYSKILPSEVDISTQLTEKIKLNIPMLSAAMDTVTEASLAIALAREGGLGILHKNMSIQQQADQVRKVKRSESGLIIDPITLHPDSTIGEAVFLMKENKIGGIPIIDKARKLVGILTNRDLRFERNNQQKVSSVMTSQHLITAPEGTDLKKAELIFKKNKIEKLPVVDKSGKLIGLITFGDILKLTSHPNSVKDTFGRLLVGAGVGITKDILERVEALHHVGVDVICIDSAHGHTKSVIDNIKKIKS
jgi:IMP dehydrogenase